MRAKGIDRCQVLCLGRLVVAEPRIDDRELLLLPDRLVAARAGERLPPGQVLDVYRPRRRRVTLVGRRKPEQVAQLEDVRMARAEFGLHLRHRDRQVFMSGNVLLEAVITLGDRDHQCRLQLGLAAYNLLDEDYLVLSTVHSAKGQEWDAVYVLNVTDGNFPSEFAAGEPKLIEEERRLLYVAMTRARQSLTLIAPLRFHVTQQRRDGDRHVYGARSRFVTDALLATLQQSWHGRGEVAPGPGAVSARSIDVASRMRDMWG